MTITSEAYARKINIDKDQVTPKIKTSAPVVYSKKEEKNGLFNIFTGIMIGFLVGILISAITRMIGIPLSLTDMGVIVGLPLAFSAIAGYGVF